MNSKQQTLAAPVSGQLIPLSQVSDPAFADGLIGPGIAICPADGHIVSPCTGWVEGISDTLHAYRLRTDDGLELLLHIGIDTVELGGEGFTSAVQTGDTVQIGTPIARVDPDLLHSRGYDPTVLLILPDSDGLALRMSLHGGVWAGKDPVIAYEKSNK